MQAGERVFAKQFGNKHPTTEVSQASGKQVSSGLISDDATILTGLILVSNGVDDASAILFDNTSASGKQLGEFLVSGEDKVGGFVSVRWSATNGVYLQLSGSGAAAYVFYIPLL